jgi:proton-translocating NADH-quinone oxidoreductase chain N
MATELWLAGLGLVMLTADCLLSPRRGHWLGWLGLAGLLAAFVPAAGGCETSCANPALFGGLYMADHFLSFFRIFAVLQGVLVTLLSLDYLEHIRVDRGVYFTLLIFATLAMILLAGANDLVMIYLSVEFLSITSYILAGFLLGADKAHLGEIKRSAEASLKYLIYGAVASAVMLYGFSLMYGLAGGTDLTRIAATFGQPGNELVKLLAVALALVGLGFKVSAVPFHQWAPDVYEGAPTPVTALLAVGSKGAAFALLARVMILGLGGFQGHWSSLLAIIAVATMFTGNLLALVQSNFKRLLAYSAIAHAGYMLVALVCDDPEHHRGVQALLIYLMAYLLMTLGTFAFVIWYQRQTGSENIEDYAGLAGRDAPMAVVLSILMLSLTGIPPTAGFIGKLHILLCTANPQWWWLGAVVVINSVISLYYYWNVARLMWLVEPTVEFKPRRTLCTPAVVWFCGLLTLGLGLQFEPLLSVSDAPLAPFAGEAALTRRGSHHRPRRHGAAPTPPSERPPTAAETE